MKFVKSRHKHHGTVTIPSCLQNIKAERWDETLIIDPQGYFLIKIEKGHIYAGRVVKNMMKGIVYGKTAEDVYQLLIKKKWVSRLDHAAYLGKELHRAELCMQQKKKFVQE